MKRNMGDWDRLVSTAAGAALIGVAVRRRRAVGVAAALGSALVARGLAGRCPVYAATGLSSRESMLPRALPEARVRTLTASITINRSASDVSEYFRTSAHLPAFVEQLQCFEERSENSIRWFSHVDSDIRTTGIATFTDLVRGGCEVSVRMDYDQAGGPAGAAVLRLLGRSPEGRLREDLRRLKSLLETGEVAVPAAPAGTRTLTYRALKAMAR